MAHRGQISLLATNCRALNSGHARLHDRKNCLEVIQDLSFLVSILCLPMLTLNLPNVPHWETAEEVDHQLQELLLKNKIHVLQWLKIRFWDVNINHSADEDYNMEAGCCVPLISVPSL